LKLLQLYKATTHGMEAEMHTNEKRAYLEEISFLLYQEFRKFLNRAHIEMSCDSLMVLKVDISIIY